jgi:hypothetical protein
MNDSGNRPRHALERPTRRRDTWDQTERSQRSDFSGPFRALTPRHERRSSLVTRVAAASSATAKPYFACRSVHSERDFPAVFQHLRTRPSRLTPLELATKSTRTRSRPVLVPARRLQPALRAFTPAQALSGRSISGSRTGPPGTFYCTRRTEGCRPLPARKSRRSAVRTGQSCSRASAR